MGVNSKDKTDIYYKMSKCDGYRARSAYKLKQIDEYCNILEGVKNVIDLCGAPGGWSQYVSRKLQNVEHNVVCVDIQEMHEISGVTILNEDINSDTCVETIRNTLNYEGADLVLCDGAPDVIGIHDVDEFHQMHLVVSALSVACKVGLKESHFVAKIFRGTYTRLLIDYLRRFYRDVRIVKPKASRLMSIECFAVCKHLQSTAHVPFYFKNWCDCSDFAIEICGDGPDADLLVATSNGGKVLNGKMECPPVNPPYKLSIECRQSQNKRGV